MKDDGLSWKWTKCTCGGRDHPRHEVPDHVLDFWGGGLPSLYVDGEVDA